jgi:hypothetical protein
VFVDDFDSGGARRKDANHERAFHAVHAEETERVMVRHYTSREQMGASAPATFLSCRFRLAFHTSKYLVHRGLKLILLKACPRGSG